MDLDTTVATLAERLATLERRHRRRGLIVAICLGLLILAGVGGAAFAVTNGQSAYRAQSFVLVDSAGRERGGLVVEGGRALVRLLDERGEITVELGGDARLVPANP